MNEECNFCIHQLVCESKKITKTVQPCGFFSVNHESKEKEAYFKELSKMNIDREKRFDPENDLTPEQYKQWFKYKNATDIAWKKRMTDAHCLEGLSEQECSNQYYSEGRHSQCRKRRIQADKEYFDTAELSMLRHGGYRGWG